METYLNNFFADKIKRNKVKNCPDIEFDSYNEFLTLYEEDKVDVFVYYKTEFIDILGSRRELNYHSIFMSTPIVLSLISIILSIVFGNLFFLLGILTSILGFLLALPFTTKGYISKLFFCIFGLFIYLLIIGQYVGSFLAFTYLFSLLFVKVARQQCKEIVFRSLLTSEAFFIWLHENGLIWINRKEQ